MKTKIKLGMLAFLMSFSSTFAASSSGSYAATTDDFNLIDEINFYDYINFWNFFLKDRSDSHTATGSFFYTSALSASTGSLKHETVDLYFATMGKTVTSSGYVGLLSGIIENPQDVNVQIFLSNTTNSKNTQRPGSGIYDISDSQSSTGYGVWLDRLGFFHGSSYDETNLLFYATGSTFVRPMPFDYDGDGLSNNLDLTKKGNFDNDLLDNGPRDWDSDGDGWSDGEELVIGTSPLGTGVAVPLDDDGTSPDNTCTTSESGNFLANSFECAFFANGTGTGETCRLAGNAGPLDDCDGDGIVNREEQQYNCDPTVKDTDGDGINDFKEIAFGLNCRFDDAELDYDGDGLSNLQEVYGYPKEIKYINSGGSTVTYTIDWISDPRDTFTSQDGFQDNYEWDLSTFPRSSNGGNVTHPTMDDTDMDGVKDGLDADPLDATITTDIYGQSPTDTDMDNLPDWWEDHYTNGRRYEKCTTENLSDGPGLLRISRLTYTVDGAKTGSLISSGLSSSGYGLNKNLTDTDFGYIGLEDGINDGAEDGDFDNDGLSNYLEYVNGTNPNNWDSDSDGMSDGDEAKYGFNPCDNSDGGDANWDKDGYTNVQEVNGITFDLISYSNSGTCAGTLTTVTTVFTDPKNKYTDPDSLIDHSEAPIGLDPTNPDTDGDGVYDGEELTAGTNPYCFGDFPADDDGDGLRNSTENKYTLGSNTRYSSGGIASTGWLITSSGATMITGPLLSTYPLDPLDTDSNNTFPGDGFEDFDGDACDNIREQSMGTDLFNWDTDGDGIGDCVDTDPLNPGIGGCSKDGDELCDLFEIRYTNGGASSIVVQSGGTTLSGSGVAGSGFSLDYLKADSDGDGTSDKKEGISSFDLDGWSNLKEQEMGTDPNNWDTDGDGIPDNLDSDPLTCNLSGAISYDCATDTDHDGIPDKDEIYGWTSGSGSTNGTIFRTDYLIYDSDGDGLSDGYERLIGTNPLNNDTDGDGWLDGSEVTVAFIDPGFSDPDDNSIKPMDSNGNWIPDVWATYYGKSESDSDSTTRLYAGEKALSANDIDLDGISDYREHVYGTNPAQDNGHFNPTNILQSPSCLDTDWGTGPSFSGVTALNLLNIDRSRSGFFSYENYPGDLLYNRYLTTDQAATLTSGAGDWLNADSTGSSLLSVSGAILSTSIYSENDKPIGPNSFGLTITEDSYRPHIALKIVDYIFGDPSQNFERFIYLGRTCVDTTAPVCSVLLRSSNLGSAHEQRASGINWREDTGLSGLSTGVILSVTGSTSDLSSYTGITISSTYGQNYSYTGSFFRTLAGYIPWTTGTGANARIKFIDSYKDNISGLDSSSYLIVNTASGFTLTGSFTLRSSSNFSGALSFSSTSDDSNDICKLNSGFCDASNEYHNKIVNIQVTDLAGNTSTCSSQITKVDLDKPVVRIDEIYDDFSIGSSFGTGNVTSSFSVNAGNTVHTSLFDSKTYGSGGLYVYGMESSSLSAGVSSFRPSDFNLKNIYYCSGSGQTTCENEIQSASSTDLQLAKYLYKGTGVVISDDLPGLTSSGVFFLKDAFYSNTGVLLTSTGNFLSSASGASISQVLFTSSGSAYLSTSTGHFLIDNYNTPMFGALSYTGFVPVTYNNGFAYGSGAFTEGTFALKIYGSGAYTPEPGDPFYLSFRFKDRAGNEFSSKHNLKVKDNIYAKILGNIATSDQGIEVSKYDSRVKEFVQNESQLIENVFKIKQNLKNLFAKAKNNNGSGVIVSSISDLDSYKTKLGGEEIYIVKNGDIILGTGLTTLDLSTSNKPVTIVAYGGNILINSKYIDSTKNTAIIALVDPSLAATGSLPREAQGNVLVSPELLIGRGQMIAEGSIVSFGNIDGKIQTVFSESSRRSLLKKQLIWDGVLMSNNTVGGALQTQPSCPVSLYGTPNNCDMADLLIQKNISFMYDLHFLRTYAPGAVTTKYIDGVVTKTQIGTGHIVTNLLEHLHTLDSSVFPTITSATDVAAVHTISATPSDVPNSLKSLPNTLKNLDVYPVIIKHSTPNKKMKAFE